MSSFLGEKNVFKLQRHAFCLGLFQIDMFSYILRTFLFQGISAALPHFYYAVLSHGAFCLQQIVAASCNLDIALSHMHLDDRLFAEKVREICMSSERQNSGKSALLKG